MKIILFVLWMFYSILPQQTKYVSDAGSDGDGCGAANDTTCKTISYAFGNNITDPSQVVTVSIVGSSTVNTSVVLDAAGPRVISSLNLSPLGTIFAVSNSTESYIQTSGNLTFVNVNFSFNSVAGNSTDPAFISVVGSNGILNLTNIVLSVSGVLNSRFVNFTTGVGGTFTVSNFTVSNVATSRMIFALNGSNVPYIATLNNLILRNVSQAGERTLDELIYFINTNITMTNASFDAVSNNNSDVFMAENGNLNIVGGEFKNTDGTRGTLMYICFMTMDMRGAFNLSNAVFNNLKVVDVAIHLHMTGPVTISNSNFTGLSSVQGGGAVRLEHCMSLSISTSNFTNCVSTGGDGGAIYLLLPDGNSNYTLQGLTFANNTDFEGNISHIFINGTDFHAIILPEKFNFTWRDEELKNLYHYYGVDRANNGGNDNNTAGTRESLVPFLYCADEFNKTGCPPVLCQYIVTETGPTCYFDDTCATFFPTEETDSCPWDCRIELENWVCVRQCTEGYFDINENCVEDKCQLNKPNMTTFTCDKFEGADCFAQDTSCVSECAVGFTTDNTSKQCRPICSQLAPSYSHKTENMHCPDPCWVEEYSCVTECNLKLYNNIDVAQHVCYRRECNEISPSANKTCPFGCLYKKKGGKETCNLHCGDNYVVDVTKKGTCIYDPEKTRANVTVAIIIVILVIIVVAVVICICWRLRHPDQSGQQHLPADLYGGKTVQPVSSLFGGGVGSSSSEPHQAVTERVDFFSDEKPATQNSSLNAAGSKKTGGTYGSF